jgi:hypothetical protein
MNRTNGKRWLVLLALLAVAVGGGWALLYRGAGAQMTASAEAFLASLEPEQRALAVMAFDDPKRLDWHFIPKPERKGLQVKDMTDPQRKLAHRLLASTLSQVGYDKAETIMRLEAILRELEKSRADGPVRDPERYYFTLFGEPTPQGTWGLSVEGHHLSLNFVVNDGELAATTPTFFGANPAEVRNPAGTDFEPGFRVLKPEEDLGFQLLAALAPEQKDKALIAEMAPADLRGAGEPQAPDTSPEGLPAAEMTEDQVKLLWDLLGAYCANVPQEIGEARLDRVAVEGIEKVFFAWAGASEPGIGHYYRIQGPTFLVEFVNTQPDAEGNPANHIHSFWRDTAGDFGIAR